MGAFVAVGVFAGGDALARRYTAWRARRAPT
jgi:hypothetical protein